LQSFLENCEGGTIESDPIFLKINIDLGDTLLGSVWSEILDLIENADKYVALDLSACSVTGNEFETYLISHNGKKKVVSLIFPDDVESLPSGGYTGPSHFSFAIKELTGKNIIMIGNSVFAGCSKLDKVSFPKATSIESNNFSGSNLKNVSFPEVINIGNSAFYSCDSLEIISFPKVKSIGTAAFTSCSSLENVSFPEVKSIGDRAFGSCINLKSVSFPEVTSIINYSFYSCPIISITIAADCTLTDTRIRDGFDSYYNSGGKAAGTYTFNDVAWEGP